MPRTPQGIQYLGLPGVTRNCVDAVVGLIQNREDIVSASLLTNAGTHCLLLHLGEGDTFAIKSGFSSGYGGEGPAGLSFVLLVLDTHGIPIEEFEVKAEVIDRVDCCALTFAEVEKLKAGKPVRPTRWWDYTARDDRDDLERIAWHWSRFRPVIPFAIIDVRISDLAIAFWNSPDHQLMTGYRRLEGIVRTRTGLDEHSAKLFSQAFQPETGPLFWPGLPGNEQSGRMSLFTGAFMTYRNARAHQELQEDSVSLLREFLLLNHLYQLEGSSVLRPDVNSAAGEQEAGSKSMSRPPRKKKA